MTGQAGEKDPGLPFLDRMARRAVGDEGVLRVRPRSRFEPGSNPVGDALEKWPFSAQRGIDDGVAGSGLATIARAGDRRTGNSGTAAAPPAPTVLGSSVPVRADRRAGGREENDRQTAPDVVTPASTAGSILSEKPDLAGHLAGYEETTREGDGAEGDRASAAGRSSDAPFVVPPPAEPGPPRSTSDPVADRRLSRASMALAPTLGRERAASSPMESITKDGQSADSGGAPAAVGAGSWVHDRGSEGWPQRADAVPPREAPGLPPGEAPDPEALVREHVVPVLIERGLIGRTESVAVGPGPVGPSAPRGTRVVPGPATVGRADRTPGSGTAPGSGCGDVHVHIGTIEVQRPVPPVTRPPAPPARLQPGADLDAYLTRRKERR